MSPKKDEYMRGYADGFKDGRISRLIVPQAQVDTGAAYHWREGLYFRRHDETVEIVQMRSTEQVAWRWLVPEVEWQSILNYLGSGG